MAENLAKTSVEPFFDPHTIITEDLIPELSGALVEMSDKWDELGIAVKLPRYVRKQCRHDSNVVALDNILSEWIERAKSPPTLRDLKEALMNPILCQNRLAQKVFNFPTEEVNLESLSVSHSFMHETEQLKGIYSKRKEIPTDHWPPVGIDTCINLALINSSSRSKISRDYDYSVRGDPDDILHEKTMVEYKDIFGEHAAGKVILVEGRPGSGKTTLVSKISKDWATDESCLVNTKMLFLVPLRSFDKKSSHDLSDILEMFSLNKPQVINSIEVEQGRGSCFILDGLDEYKICDGKSIVLSLIYKTCLPECMVIVTSRPVATAEMRKSACIYKTIEVLGFKGEQIYEYIERYPFDNTSSKSTLKSYLDLHSNIFHMCYLPVHSAMICFLYDKRGRIPETETKVYEEFIRLIVSRNNMRCNKPSHIDALDVISGEHREQFSKICKLAFEMTIQSKQLIHEKDTEVTILSSAELVDESTLGLLTVDKALALYNVENTYSFLHLTLQEFLAAYHISQLDEEEQVKVLSNYSLNLDRNYVYVFYCGMTQFTQNDLRLKRFKHCPYIMQIAFESQQSVVCDLALKKNRLYDEERHLTLRDMIESAYIVSHANEKLYRIIWISCSLTAEKFCLFFEQVNKDKLQYIEYIDLSHNYLDSEECSQIVLKLQSIMKLKILVMDGNYVDNSVAKHLGSLVDLEVLAMQQCWIDSKTSHILLKSLKGTKIERLDLSHNFIGFDQKATWDELKHLTDLKDLIINNNYIDVVSLLKVLENTKLTGLSLMSNFRSVCMIAFSLLFQLQSLNYVELNGSKFMNDSLAIAPPSSNNLETLMLCNCNLNDQQSAELLQALRHCTNLATLDLSLNTIGNKSIPYLCTSLRVWKELTRLYLTETNIDTEGAKSLAEVIGNCKKMTYFDISHNAIHSTGALALVHGLKACTQLKYFGVIDKSVDDFAVKTIEEDMEARQCELYRGVKLQRNNSFTRSNRNFDTYYLTSKRGDSSFFNDFMAVLKCVRSDAYGQATPTDTSRDKPSEASSRV